MRRLKPLDASWLYVESRNTPMHVAGLHIFKPSAKAGPDFVRDLVAQCRAATHFVSPWNLRLANSPLRAIAPAWEVDRNIDLDYHVRHSALPQPGGERELGVLVARLHSHPLDLHRPLWECHIIEGLEGGRFALYTKMHHSLMDGIASMRMVQQVLSESPRERKVVPPWAHAELKTEDQQIEDLVAHVTSARRKRPLAQAREQVGHLPSVVRAMRSLWNEDADLTPPFSAPKSLLNERITAQRRVATQQYKIKRLQSLAKAAGVTLNDVVLAICAAALRRFMLERGELPEEPLTAGLPVSIRPKGDASLGSAISFIIANLATDVSDPVSRLQAIHDSTARAKEHLQGLPKPALNAYTAVLMAPFLLAQLSGTGGRGRPMFNLTISNVPGPAKPLYFAGAKLLAMYPISLLTHGQALNITCVSYADTIDFGFTGCRDTLPHMQRLALYTGEALDELEMAVQGEQAEAGE